MSEGYTSKIKNRVGTTSWVTLELVTRQRVTGKKVETNENPKREQKQSSDNGPRDECTGANQGGCRDAFGATEKFDQHAQHEQNQPANCSEHFNFLPCRDVAPVAVVELYPRSTTVRITTIDLHALPTNGRRWC